MWPAVLDTRGRGGILPEFIRPLDLMRLLLLSLVVWLFSPITAGAANWPQLRGPNMNGSSPEQGLPEKFSKEENVRWVADLPGRSAATPAIWEDHVFLSTTNEEGKSLEAWCLNRTTGEVRWRREIAKSLQQDDRSNFASPSPATDGKLVYFFYGTGDLVALDFDGNEKWRRNIQDDYGRFAFLWTFSTSPMLFDGKLYLQVLQRDDAVNGRGFADKPNDSYLLCLDPETGKEMWKTLRPSDAVAESREAFTTPVVHTHEGRTEILIAGGDCVSGHDPATGREHWRWGTWNPERIGHWRLVPSPVAGDGVVVVCAPKREPVFGIRLGGEGDLGEAGVAWKSADRDVSSDVSTPAYADGRFFVLHSDRGSIACLRPKTGEVVWSERLESRSKFEASPVVADGKIYAVNHLGEVFVMKAGDEFALLHKAELGDNRDEVVRATPAVSGGNLFVRTDRKLYCFGAE